MGGSVKKKIKMNHVLIYADFGCATGFATVTKKLVDNWQHELGNNCKIIIFSINDIKNEPYEYKDASVIPGQSLSPEGNTDVYHREAFLSLIHGNEFNTIFFLNDIEVLRTINNHLLRINELKVQNKKLQFKTVFYFPIDSKPKKSDVDILLTFDSLITYTNYAKNVICNILPEIKDKVDVAYHGQDLKVFYPIIGIDTYNLKKEKEKRFGKDAFVFGNVNRNSARKDISSTILAFNKFKYSNQLGIEPKNAVLYLHMNQNDYHGINIAHLCERLGLEIGKDVFYPEMFSEKKGIEVIELNRIYNMFDVFITTTTAEGWGLTVTEAMACKIPTIVPQHTSLEEITDFGNNCFPIRQLEDVVFLEDGEKVRFKTNTNVLAEIMTFIYNSPKEELDKVALKGYEKVKEFKWKITSDIIWSHISKYFK